MPQRNQSPAYGRFFEFWLNMGSNFVMRAGMINPLRLLEEITGDAPHCQ
jgi:hypothetical protein